MAKRIVRFNEVKERTGLSGSTIWAKIKTGEFPQPIRLTERTIGFDEAELEAFIERRKATPYSPTDMRRQVEGRAAKRAASRAQTTGQAA